MSRDYDDDELHAIRAAFEREDTPTAPHRLLQPRGHAVCARCDVVADAVAGAFVGSDVPTPDPPDLRMRRVMPNEQFFGGLRR